MKSLRLAVPIFLCVLVAAGCVPAALPPQPSPTPVLPTSIPPIPAPPTAAPPAPAMDLVAPVKAYVAALNAGDVDGVLALVTDDVSWFELGGDHASGKEQLRTLLDWWVTLEAKHQITDCQPQADRVACRLSSVEACTAAFGATEGWPLKLVLVYGPDGKIQQVFSTKDGPQWNDLPKWWVGRNAWASANRPAELAKSTERTKEGGLIDARLCKDYAASLAIDGKIQDAMSAAPMAIAKDATVVDWPAPGGGDLVVLREGTNDWTCYPDWTASPGNDPECNDPVMEAWFRALMAGDKQPPEITSAGIAYMLMGGSDPSNTDPMAAAPATGEDWVTSPAHVMLIVPGGFDAKLFSTDPKSGEPYIMWDGTPYEHLMVPVVPMAAQEMGNLDAALQNTMSSAPSAIAEQATILGWPAKASDPMEILRKGTNAWTCIADWPASPGNDPECMDPMWMVWNDAYAAGKVPEITGPGIAYMLAGGSDPSNTDPMATAPAPGEEWVNSGPHLMLLVPGGFDANVFSTDPKSGGPYIMWDGTPYEHVMVPVTDMPK
jgi:ketosteroid isomerase-like protein